MSAGASSNKQVVLEFRINCLEMADDIFCDVVQIDQIIFTKKVIYIKSTITLTRDN
jgi:hypothetical protein